MLMNSKARGAVYLCLFLALAFFCIPLSIAHIYRDTFWTLTDYEPLGLGDALNMAYRLADRHLYYAQGLTNHPGVPFYFLSWFALALTGHPVASGDSSFYSSVLDHVEDYHLAIRTLAALIGALGVYLYARVALRVVPAGVAIIGVLLWLVSTPATLETFISAGNDAFAMIVNALFFAVLIPLAYEDDVDPYVLVLAGFVGALAFLNKLSYIYVPFALYAAAFVKIVGSGIRWPRHFRLMAIYFVSLLLVLYAAGFMVMGRQAMRDLHSFQTGVFWGTGLYGSGDQTVVSGNALLQAFANVPVERSYAIFIALVGGVCLVIGGLITGWRHRQHLPVAVIGVGAGGAAVLSALIVLKHYAMHYTAGVSATLPACVVAGYLLLGAWGVWRLLPRISTIVGISGSVIAILLLAAAIKPRLETQFAYQAHRAELAEADTADLKKYLAGVEGGVEFGYRSPMGEFGEGSVVATASVPRITYDYFRGRPKNVSGALTHSVVRDIGAYVLDKQYFPTVEAIKQSSNLSLLNADPVKFKDADKLIELRTVFLLIRS